MATLPGERKKKKKTFFSNILDTAESFSFRKEDFSIETPHSLLVSFSVSHKKIANEEHDEVQKELAENRYRLW